MPAATITIAETTSKTSQIIYEAPPRFLSTKPVQECHDIRGAHRRAADQLRKLVEAPQR